MNRRFKLYFSFFLGVAIFVRPTHADPAVLFENLTCQEVFETQAYLFSFVDYNRTILKSTRVETQANPIWYRQVTRLGKILFKNLNPDEGTPGAFYQLPGHETPTALIADLFPTDINPIFSLRPFFVRGSLALPFVTGFYAYGFMASDNAILKTGFAISFARNIPGIGLKIREDIDRIRRKKKNSITQIAGMEFEKNLRDFPNQWFGLNITFPRREFEIMARFNPNESRFETYYRLITKKRVTTQLRQFIAKKSPAFDRLLEQVARQFREL